MQLSEEYTNKYLLDISAKIQQQSTILDNLEERLEAANKLQGDAVNLQMFYESGTVSIMKDLRATGKAVPCVRRDQILRLLISGLSRPLPQDNALFCEVDLVLAEIRRFYEELNKFWTEEIRHVVEVIKQGRTDPRDLERWKNFNSSLNRTIEFWRVCCFSLCIFQPIKIPCLESATKR